MPSSPSRRQPAGARSGSAVALYFAYGSNLDHRQMRARCPSARVESKAVLSGYAIAFGGYSHRWGGSVASLVRVHGARVEGLIYKIDRADVARLDQFEGVPFAYIRLAKEVHDAKGRRRRTQVYLQVQESFEVTHLPALAYFKQILAAYDRLGFDIDPLRAAVGLNQ